MQAFDGKVAVITGASSGIGRALAQKLADLGCHLAIADLDLEGLRATAELARRADRRITLHQLDVSEREAVFRLADAVASEHGQADLLINNAGVSTCIEIEYLDYGYFESLMKIDFWGVVYGCKAFLPLLKQRPEAHIVNVSSIFAIAVPPRYAAYSAAKAALAAFTETLAAEFLVDKIPIGVACVFPGGVSTGIGETSERHARRYFETHAYDQTVIPEEKLKWLEERGVAEKARLAAQFQKLTSPEEAAEDIVAGIRKNRRRILIGQDAQRLDELVRSDPDHYLQRLPEYLGAAYF